MKDLIINDFDLQVVEFDSGVYLATSMDLVEAIELARQIHNNREIIDKLKEHYIGTSEHASDCSVCYYLKPILEKK